MERVSIPSKRKSAANDEREKLRPPAVAGHGHEHEVERPARAPRGPRGPRDGGGGGGGAPRGQPVTDRPHDAPPARFRHGSGMTMPGHEKARLPVKEDGLEKVPAPAIENRSGLRGARDENLREIPRKG